jgi:hypothetical protein
LLSMLRTRFSPITARPIRPISQLADIGFGTVEEVGWTKPLG